MNNILKKEVTIERVLIYPSFSFDFYSAGLCDVYWERIPFVEDWGNVEGVS